ncbi:hypothetical protein HHI36_022385 [Cryptolaemus montrouzieri]|uniref:Uncharacterized protein n=1 Tax=Cryptolaemus montrouzieri TaxID=559131 RepID=A0ABD2MZX3_9CUCU
MKQGIEFKYPEEVTEPYVNEQQAEYDENFGKVKKKHQRQIESLLEKGCTETVTGVLMKKAENEEKQAMTLINNGNTSDSTVPRDGTWQKLGYTSSFGISSVIGCFTGNTPVIALSIWTKD